MTGPLDPGPYITYRLTKNNALRRRLDRQFGAQLIAAGWRRVGGAVDASLAVGVWRKSVDGNEVQAVVSAVNALGGDGRRDLSLVVSIAAATTTSQNGAFAGSVNTLPVGVPAPVLVPPPVLSVAPPTAARAVASPVNSVAGPAPTTMLGRALAASAAPGFQLAPTESSTNPAKKPKTTKTAARREQ